MTQICGPQIVRWQFSWSDTDKCPAGMIPRGHTIRYGEAVLAGTNYIMDNEGEPDIYPDGMLVIATIARVSKKV